VPSSRSASRPRAGELVGHRSRLHPVERVARERDPGGRGQREHGPVQLLAGQREGGEDRARAGAQPLPRRLDRIVQRDPAGVAQDLAEGPVGDAASGRQAAALEHGDLRVTFPHGREELPHQAALADPRRPVHEREP